MAKKKKNLQISQKKNDKCRENVWNIYHKKTHQVYKNYEEKYENDTTMTIQQFSNMKTYLHLLIIREIRTILKYYSSPIRSAKFLNSDNIFYWRGYR